MWSVLHVRILAYVKVLGASVVPFGRVENVHFLLFHTIIEHVTARKTPYFV